MNTLYVNKNGRGKWCNGAIKFEQEEPTVLQAEFRSIYYRLKFLVPRADNAGTLVDRDAAEGKACLKLSHKPQDTLALARR